MYLIEYTIEKFSNVNGSLPCKTFHYAWLADKIDPDSVMDLWNRKAKLLGEFYKPISITRIEGETKAGLKSKESRIQWFHSTDEL